ncbi:MAG: lactoylglutathione lyase [Bacteroidetes bacterium]|nr:lactoylglutathione lyase [Bacteroidota bacterium]
MKVEIILYVKDQARSRDFYCESLSLEPSMDVPGMTEFDLNDNCKLGLMPVSSISKILGDKLPHPSSGDGIPRCELYLEVEDVILAFERAMKTGAVIVSPVSNRDWDYKVGYLCDPDGHVIAFAQKISSL